MCICLFNIYRYYIFYKRDKKLTNDEQIFETKKENMLKDVKEEKEELIANAKKEISDIISKMHNSDMRVH